MPIPGARPLYARALPDAYARRFLAGLAPTRAALGMEQTVAFALAAPRRRGAGCRGRGGRRAAGSPVPRGRGPRRCDHGLRHNLTGRYHPWTNGQAERLNRTVKDATVKDATVKDAIVKAYHHVTHAALEAHMRAFLAAYNVAKHLHTYATMGTPCLAW